MHEGIKKFTELLHSDEAFRAKLTAAAENYTGEKTEEAIFSNILVPVAAEYGISVPYEEFQKFSSASKLQPLDDNELNQVAGGKAGGVVCLTCKGVGVGSGAGGGEGTGGACALLGFGWNTVVCGGQGATNKDEYQQIYGNSDDGE